MKTAICLHSVAVVINVSLEAYVIKGKKLAKITVISALSATLAVVKLHSAQTLQHVFLSAREIQTVKKDVARLVIVHQRKIFAKLAKRWTMTTVMWTQSVNHASVSTNNVLLRLQ